MITLTSDRHLGALMRRMRLDAGLTLDQLGARVHITRKGVCNRELKSRAVTVGALIDTAQALDYDLVLVPRHPGTRPTGTGWPT